jgi:diazepam-binding inhibitor (GABA receptor modulating acyl-CoA-binding protein)
MHDEFEVAAQRVKTLKIRPPDAQMLQLYGLYKQGTVGDNLTPQPWAIQYEARAKWDAWKSHESKLPNIARQEYITLVYQLGEQFGFTQ